MRTTPNGPVPADVTGGHIIDINALWDRAR